MARVSFGTTWWGRQWLQALSDIENSNRAPRGKRYAASGKVFEMRLDTKNGQIRARVKGYYRPYYSITISFLRISNEDRERFIDAAVKDIEVMADLSNRKLSPRVLDLLRDLRISLFPESWSDLGMRCDCPDGAVPCKHLSAVIYKFCEYLDADPFLLFTMRGIDLLREVEMRGFRFEHVQSVETQSCAEMLEAALTDDAHLMRTAEGYGMELVRVNLSEVFEGAEAQEGGDSPRDADVARDHGTAGDASGATPGALSDGVVAKKRRGRPPKSAKTEEQEARSGSDAGDAALPDGVVAKKRRGRPPKSAKSEEQDARSGSDAGDAALPDAVVAKKRRGRPPKSAKSEEQGDRSGSDAGDAALPDAVVAKKTPGQTPEEREG